MPKPSTRKNANERPETEKVPTLIVSLHLQIDFALSSTPDPCVASPCDFRCAGEKEQTTPLRSHADIPGKPLNYRFSDGQTHVFDKTLATPLSGFIFRRNTRM
jgi:hypothetical protein